MRHIAQFALVLGYCTMLYFSIGILFATVLTLLIFDNVRTRRISMKEVFSRKTAIALSVVVLLWPMVPHSAIKQAKDKRRATRHHRNRERHLRSVA